MGKKPVKLHKPITMKDIEPDEEMIEFIRLIDEAKIKLYDKMDRSSHIELKPLPPLEEMIDEVLEEQGQI